MAKFKISCSHFFKLLLIAGFVGFFLLFLVQKGLADGTCNGTPTVEKFFLPPSVKSGDPVSVVITVEGCDGRVEDPIPFDGVLLIDMSGSMAYSDPGDLRLDAAISFVNCVAPQTRLAIVTFADYGALVQELTSSKSVLEHQIDGLRGNAHGRDSMYEGMKEAQDQLIPPQSSDQGERFIILLTDARCFWHSDSEFSELVDEAVANDIQYLTIALGDEAGHIFLQHIAELYFPLN